jgi:probable HAF family extracellular repeat protein
MSGRVRAVHLLVPFLVFLLSTAALAGVTMEVLPLLPGDIRAEVQAINDNGLLVGYSYPSVTGVRHAFAWDRSVGLRELPSLGSTYAEAADVNNAGQAVGRSADAAGYVRAVLWQADGMPVPLGSGEAYRINDNGEVIGALYSAPGQVAFFWSPVAGMRSITSAVRSLPLDINAAGQVVGFFGPAGAERAFSWSLAGGFVDLTPLVGSPATAYGINDLGEIVGTAGGAAFLLRSGSVERIAAGQAAPTVAFGINNRSQVYGVSDADPDNQRSFFWSDATGYLDLGTVGGGYTSPSGMNDAGLVAGWSEAKNRKYHAVYFDPASGLVDLTPGRYLYGTATAVGNGGLIAGWTIEQVKKVTKYAPVLWTITP